MTHQFVLALCPHKFHFPILGVLAAACATFPAVRQYRFIFRPLRGIPSALTMCNAVKECGAMNSSFCSVNLSFI